MATVSSSSSFTTTSTPTNPALNTNTTIPTTSSSSNSSFATKTTSGTTSLLVSGQWIAEIYRCEKLIVELILQVAGILDVLAMESSTTSETTTTTTTSVLSFSTDSFLEEKESHHETKISMISSHIELYFTKLNDIQTILRKHFRLLTVEGISTVLPPFRANIYKEEQVYVDLVQALQFVVKKVETMQQIIQSR